MTDKELIKQEIERLKHTSNAYDRSRFMLLLEIEKFINSLPEEPTSEDLKKEISKWRNHYISVLDNNLRIDLRDIEVIANHFAEWQKKKAMQDIEPLDCLKEGVKQVISPWDTDMFAPYNGCTEDDLRYSCVDAFAILIDKISGKGTWDKNPYTFVYSFKLVK